MFRRTLATESWSPGTLATKRSENALLRLNAQRQDTRLDQCSSLASPIDHAAGPKAPLAAAGVSTRTSTSASIPHIRVPVTGRSKGYARFKPGSRRASLMGCECR